MAKLPDLPKVKVKGPFWTADVEVIQFADPRENWAFRTLFLDNTPRAVLENQNVLLPGTLLTLCFVKQVQVRPGKSDRPVYTWKRASQDNTPKNPSQEQIKDFLRTGNLSLLLLQADPDPEKWRKDNKDAFAELTCLGGEINLDVLQADQNAAQRLYQALKLSPPNPAKDPKPVDRTGATGLPGAISVHSSGLSIYGRVSLPWQAPQISASFQLAKLLPDSENTTPGSRRFHLTIEVERLTKDENNQLIQAWSNFSHYVNPKNPLNPELDSSETPTWVTLEVANPLAVPRLYWLIAPWQENPAQLPLNFQRDEINILLSDRQPYERQNPPTSLARITPDRVSVMPISNNRLQVSVQAGANIGTAKGTLRYTRENQNSQWQEKFTLADTKVGFGPVETSQFLRDTQELPIPEWAGGENPDPVTPAVLWGFMPLEEGWAQLPVPNLTDQIYLDAGLAQLQNQSVAPSTALLQGAVSFGNDRPEILALHRDEQPWNLTLTDAQAFEGQWELKPEANGYQLERIELKIHAPEVVLNGLFWLSTGKPTTADALPNFENWLSCLDSIPLKTIQQPLFFVEAAGFQPALDKGIVSGNLRQKFQDNKIVLSSKTILEIQETGSSWIITDLENQRTYFLSTQNNKINIFDKPISDIFPFVVTTTIKGLEFSFRSLLFDVESVIFRDSLDSRTLSKELRDKFQDNKIFLSQKVGVEVKQKGSQWLIDDRESQRKYSIIQQADKLKISEIPSALLKGWSFVYEADRDVFQDLANKGVLPANTFSQNLPLVWRRHPSLPMIQVLPLTQSQSPANYPSSSRQLAPYELKTAADNLPTDWRFGVQHENGAAAWPQLLSEATPAEEWKTLFDLPLTALSLPGLVMEPEDDRLSMQYRFDLPYTDELNALAQLPKIPRDPDVVSPLPDSPPPEPPKPLTRDRFAEHWQRLAERANLASADAVNAFIQQDNQTLIQHLIEPFNWPVRPTFELGQYPGTLSLDNSNPEQSAKIDLTEETALSGISGKFVVENGNGRIKRLTDSDNQSTNPFVVTAGSMAAHRDENGAFRDQRGLLRSPSKQLSNLIKTSVKLHEDKAAYELTSTLTPFNLYVTEKDSWQIWFRDLPVQANTFSRDTVISAEAEDINDPEALSREHNFLAGYEWRLSLPSLPTTQQFSLHHLTFYPLTLEKVVFENNQVKQVEIIGRLQLPIKSGSELENFSNAVRVTFEQSSNQLKLSAVKLESDVGEWPLALKGNEATNAPLLRWHKISLNPSENSIHVEEVWLNFFLFGTEWSIPLEKLSFRSDKTEAEITPQPYEFPQTQAPKTLSPLKLELHLDLAEFAHDVSLTLGIRLGRRVVDGLQVLYTFDEGSGNTVHDVSGVGTPLDLSIQNPAATKWVSGGLAINSPTILTSAGAATKAITACRATQEITIEAWVKPTATTNVNSGFPGHIVTLSKEASNCNITLQQGLWQQPGAGFYTTRLRTTATNKDGEPPLSTSTGSLTTKLSHVVYTRDVWGVGKIYVNGVEQGSVTVGGDFSNWDESYRLMLASELTGTRPWLGEYHLVAVYDRALSATEVDQNFKAGPKTTSQLAFTAEVSFPLLDDKAGEKVVWQSASLFDDLKLVQSEADEHSAILFAGNALQLNWQTYELRGNSDLQLLPSMRLNSDKTPGFAALTFDAIANSGGVPQLQLKTAFVEALLSCRWGEFLQDGRSLESSESVRTQVFCSSAGDLVFGYTGEWKSDRWQESFLLNGFVEVKNLISWPKEMFDKNNPTQLTLPAVRSKDKPPQLNHIRHTIRILFNQHQIPSELLVVGEGNLLFNLANTKSWQFLAVVEHQLVDVLPESDLTTIHLENDRRWTTVQEVRFILPKGFKKFLNANQNTQTLDPIQGIDLIGDANSGYLGVELRSRLIESDTPELAKLPSTTLLVEASSPHWIKQVPVSGVSPTTLQFLPNGSQLGILSNPQDFEPSDPKDPKWLLLSMPFLGRLQDQKRDEVDSLTPNSANTSPLQIDPILYLHYQRNSTTQSDISLALAFTSWGNTSAVEVIVSGFDTAVGRSLSRLDPISLEENWFRLQHPIKELPPEGLQSVMASLPDTPARLSRWAALQRAFDVSRQFYPPAQIADSQLPTPATGNQIVWRQNSLMTMQGISSIRATNGLQVLYTFEEGSGTTVHDVSGVGTPLNLRVKNAAATRWIPGGLAINSSTILESAEAATKVIDACRATNEITIEVWVKPANTTQAGPARIVTLSKDPDQRNFTLGQGLGNQPSDVYDTRLRTTTTNSNGLPSLTTPAKSLTTSLSHLVYTRNAKGVAKLYINGVERASGTVGGDFSNWDRGFRLALANEFTGNRTWLGEYHLVAIYDRALSPKEVTQNFNNGSNLIQQPPYGWHFTGLQILSSNLSTNKTDVGSKLQRYPAATLLPALLKLKDQVNEIPLSFAVSPYLGLEFRPASKAVVLQLVFAELLCLDRASGGLLPAASHFWELQGEEDVPKLTEEDVYKLSQEWAVETHRRLCPESPVAILRFRKINKNTQSTSNTTAPLTTTYSFAIVTNIQLPEKLSKRVFRLRSTVSQLRFREGQFGGHQLPADIQSFEIAPPQVTGVQPIYLTEFSQPKVPDSWSWGLSALTMSVQYTQNKETKTVVGAVGSAVTNGSGNGNGQSVTLWWQAPQRFVQYRSTLHSDHPTAGLPTHFRASAIKSLLPVVPNLSLPAIVPSQLVESSSGEVERWQPILPGKIRYLMLGDRSGVMFAVRNQVLRQSGLKLNGTEPQVGEVMVSGSIPIQHRMPRPVPLPANRQLPPNLLVPANPNAEYALQTWASYFDPTHNLLVTPSPADEAFFAECGQSFFITEQSLENLKAPSVPQEVLNKLVSIQDEKFIGREKFLEKLEEILGKELTQQFSAVIVTFAKVGVPRRLQMKLKQPLHGAITPNWDGTLVFEINFESPTAKLAHWNLELELIDGQETFAYQTTNTANGYQFQLKNENDQLAKFKEGLSRKAVGDVLIASARVKPKLANNGFFQMLSFPLRLADEGTLPLPLEPYFIHFEDPEYNRRLSSASAHASRTLKLKETIEGQPKLVLHTITLSADRGEYNPNSTLALRYDWDDNRDDNTATLELKRIDPETSLPSNPLLTVNNVSSAELKQLSLLEIQQVSKVQFRPGDTLQLELKVNGTPIFLQVNIVEAPVIPVPEAAYALLRQQEVNGKSQVECVRFAWSPEPSRIELVCADDLRTEVVRRRAVFRWNDSVRSGTLSGYAIQKITQTGSTHFQMKFLK